MTASPEREPDAYAIEHIRAALAGDGRSAALGVEVVIAGERVYLHGVATTAEQRDAIGAVTAEAVAGATLPYTVCNEVTVLRLGEPEEEVL
jgi:osmotically-inducible protein OsmY